MGAMKKLPFAGRQLQIIKDFSCTDLQSSALLQNRSISITKNLSKEQKRFKNPP